MGKSSYVQHGMNLREALAAAKALGCDVRSRRRTGEVVVSHPSMSKRILLNCRKKSAPRALTGFLLALQGFEPVPSNTPAPARKPAPGVRSRRPPRRKGQKPQ